jgi:rare lipoprotein A
VRIADRGPYIHGRSIDLSHSAAAAVGMTETGLARVRMEVLQ